MWQLPLAKNKNLSCFLYVLYFQIFRILPAIQNPTSNTAIPPNTSTITCCLISRVDAKTPKDIKIVMTL